MEPNIIVAALEKNPTQFSDLVAAELTQRAIASVNAMRPEVARDLLSPAAETTGDAE